MAQPQYQQPAEIQQQEPATYTGVPLPITDTLQHDNIAPDAMTMGKKKKKVKKVKKK